MINNQIAPDASITLIHLLFAHFLYNEADFTHQLLEKIPRIVTSNKEREACKVFFGGLWTNMERDLFVRTKKIQ